MKAKDLKVGEEYLATSSNDNRWISDRRRVRILEAPVRERLSTNTYLRADHAHVELLDMETGEKVEAGTGYTRSLSRVPDSDTVTVRLAFIRMPWAEWVAQDAERRRIRAGQQAAHDKLLGERQLRLAEIREFFEGLEVAVLRGRVGGSHPGHVFDRVSFDLDDLHEWLINKEEGVESPG